MCARKPFIHAALVAGRDDYKRLCATSKDCRCDIDIFDGPVSDSDARDSENSAGESVQEDLATQ